MKKTKKIILFVSLFILLTTGLGFPFETKAEEKKVNLVHTHISTCQTGTVRQNSVYNYWNDPVVEDSCGCRHQVHYWKCRVCGEHKGTSATHYSGDCREGHILQNEVHDYRCHEYDEPVYGCGINGVLGNFSVEGNLDEKCLSVELSADVSVLSARIDMDSISYEWSTSETTEKITVNENGTYSLKLHYLEEGNPCTSSAYTVNVANIDNVAPTIISLKADITDETKEPVVLTVKAVDNTGGVGLHDQPFSWNNKKSWGDSNTFTVKKNGTYKVYVRDALGNIGTESIEISNIIAPPAPPAPARDTTPPVIYDLYADTLEPTDRVILTVVVEAGASISWDGGVTWDMGNTSLALANGLHTVMARDAAGNTAMRSINITNIRAYRNIAPEEEENPEITESEEVEEPEPANEPDESDMVQPVIPAATENPEPPSEEKIETVTVSQEKIQSTENIKKIITIAAASTGTVAAGGGFLFFGFVFFFGKTAVLYGTAGIMSQKIGKVKIRKKRQSYEISIPDRVLSKAPSSQLKLVFSKGFTKKHYHEIVLVHVNDKTVQAVIENEVLFDVQG